MLELAIFDTRTVPLKLLGPPNEPVAYTTDRASLVRIQVNLVGF
jgi:hypothetical protein